MAFSLPNVPFKLTPDDMGVPDLTTALSKGIQLSFMPAQSQANLQKTLVDNLHQALVNKYYGQDIMSQIGLRGAKAGNLAAETRLNNLKYNNPGLLGSPLMVDATVAQMLKDTGGQKAVDTHDQIQQAYPDAPLSQTVPLALQISQALPDLTQPKPQSMQDSIANALQQQQATQQAQQPIQQMPALQQSLNSVLNPPQPQQQVQQAPAPIQDLRQRAVEAEINKLEGEANYYNQGGGKLGAGGKEEQFFRAMVDRANPQLQGDPVKIDEAVEAYKTGNNGSDLAPMTQSMEDSLNRIAKYGSDTATRRQQTYASTLETVFQNAEPFAQKAFQFSGAAGKTKGGFDALLSQVGINNPDYMAYRTFVDQYVPAMVTEIGRAGGANSTDKQKAVALAQALPINLKTNTALAKQEYEQLKTIYRSIGKNVSRGIYDTQRGLKNEGNSANTNESRSDPLGIR